MLSLGTCESDISVRIESRIESEVVVYMFNADCHVGVVYLMMCKPTTLLHVTLYVLFFVCNIMSTCL